MNTTPKPVVMKSFELCFDKEPTLSDIDSIRDEAYSWHRHRVIKKSPYDYVPKKCGKFWTLTFDVAEEDWLFWCGFIAGKKWKMSSLIKEEQSKMKDKQAAEYTVTI